MFQLLVEILTDRGNDRQRLVIKIDKFISLIVAEYGPGEKARRVYALAFIRTVGQGGQFILGLFQSDNQGGRVSPDI